MKFALDTPEDGYAVESYSDDQIVISGSLFQHSVALSPGRILAQGFPASVEALTPHHFEELAQLTPQVVLLGTGRRQRFPSPAIYAPLIRQGVGVEVMSTASACRTYNIIRAEGRRVCALLLLDAPSDQTSAR